MPPHNETERGQPMVVGKPALVYPITIQDMAEDDRHPKGIRN